jgi:hypothetical protein
MHTIMLIDNLLPEEEGGIGDAACAVRSATYTRAIAFGKCNKFKTIIPHMSHIYDAQCHSPEAI